MKRIKERVIIPSKYGILLPLWTPNRRNVPKKKKRLTKVLRSLALQIILGNGKCLLQEIFFLLQVNRL